MLYMGDRERDAAARAPSYETSGNIAENPRDLLGPASSIWRGPSNHRTKDLP
jgi:hypothetical protein